MSAQKGFVPVLIVILIAVAALAGGFWIYQSNLSIPPSPSPTLKPVACTQDAKLCPDGSSVGRVGPKCEFAPCPTPESTSSAETANWKTYRNKKYGYFLKYPSDKFIDCSSIDTLSLYYKVSNDTVCGAGEGPPELSISVLDSIAASNQSNYPECYSTKEEPVKVGGIDGTKYTNTLKSENNDCNKTIVAYARLRNYILLNNKGITFQIVTNDTVNEQLNLTETIDQILSTFKFLDQDVSDQNDGNCQPRPACLDAITTPRCLMPEPAGGWCP